MTTRENQDPTAEIRDALDREVGRRFDARRLSGGPTLVAAPEREVRRRGPLDSLPIAVQWAAVAAALLGAVLGVRSVVLERRQAASPAAAKAASPPSEPLVADADVPRPAPESQPLDTRTREPRPKPSSPELPRAITAPPAEPEREPAPAPVASPPPEAPRPRSSARPVTAPPVAAAVPPQAPRSAGSPTGPAVGFGVVSPAVDLGLVGGVRVQSFAIGGRDVRPFVREVHEVGATFVLPQRPLRSSRTPRPSLVMPAVLWRTMTAPAVLLASTTEPADEAQPSGAYYARLFLGSAFDDGPHSQGLMGEGLQVVPLREHEVWGDEAQERYLKRLFDLRYVVAVDGARIAPKQEGGGEASASFLAGVNGELLDVSVQGRPTKTEGVHAVDLRVSFRAHDPSTGPRSLESTVLIENGRIVVLGLPGQSTRDASPTMTFIALSPRFDRFAEPAEDEIVVPAPGMDMPVLVEQVDVRYPDALREQRLEGKVILQAVIRKDGSVDGVQVLRVSDVEGKDHLVEAAATAVRQWRYLPARRDGEPVDCYFTIVVEFAMK